MKTWSRRFHMGAIVLVLMLALPLTAWADSYTVDGNAAASGNQNLISVSAAPDETVTVTGQLLVDWSGGNHLVAGTTVTFAVVPSQTALPTGYSVSPAAVTIPAGWAKHDFVSATSTVTFTAPASSGTYVVKWAPTVDYGNRLTGAAALNINLTVVEPPPPPPVDPPAVSATVTGTQGANGWYTSDVAVSWTVTGQDITSTTGCMDTTIAADTAGTTLTCTATNSAGSDSESVTIRRDATAPSVTYSGNAGTYDVDQTIAITCTAADALSGVAASTCANVGGAAYTFSLGSHTVSATATDNAGNSGSGQATFTVQVTYGGLCKLTKQFTTKAGIANSLCAKLNAAQVAAGRANQPAKAGPLGAYVNEVSAQSGKAIPADKAAILIRLAGSL